MSYEILFKKIGQKRWLVKSGAPFGGYSTIKNAKQSMFPSNIFVQKIRKVKK